MFFLKRNSPLKNLPFVSVLVKVSSCCSVSIAFFSYVDEQNLLKNKDGTFFCQKTNCTSRSSEKNNKNKCLLLELTAIIYPCWQKLKYSGRDQNPTAYCFKSLWKQHISVVSLLASWVCCYSQKTKVWPKLLLQIFSLYKKKRSQAKHTTKRR